MKQNIENYYAFRFTSQGLDVIEFFEAIETDDLLEIDKQKEIVFKNIRAFLSEKPHLNMLLWGERGCGKSSLIKLLLNVFKGDGLKIVELRQDSMNDIYKLYKIIRKYPQYKFILFFDDISFDHQDVKYRRFKSILEGGLEETPNNAMFVATSNKRHLIKDNVLNTDDIYSRDETNEQMSLFGRFGLIVGFKPLSKEQFLNIVSHYIEKYSVNIGDNWKNEAESYAISRGGRSGRIAKQFVIYKMLM